MYSIALFDKANAILYRNWRDGKPGVPGFSEDYASVAAGLLAPCWLGH